jgi:hypothetical protein
MYKVELYFIDVKTPWKIGCMHMYDCTIVSKWKEVEYLIIHDARV